MLRPKKPNLSKIKQYLPRTRDAIKEVVREPTSGGIIFRHGKESGEVEFLLIQDSKDRWTIPKGHIEPGETPLETARREIGEETGLHNVEMLGWLGKIDFRYRRLERLVLMTTQIYLVRSLTDGEEIQKEDWMNDIRWIPFSQAIDEIAYDDIAKLMLKAKTRIRKENL